MTFDLPSAAPTTLLCSHACSQNIATEILPPVESLNTAEFNFQELHNFYCRSVSSEAGFIPLRKNFTHKSLHSWRNLFCVVILAYFRMHFRRIVIHTIQKSGSQRWPVSCIRIYPRAQLSISVLSVVEKKRRVRRKTSEKGKEILFVLEARS